MGPQACNVLALDPAVPVSGFSDQADQAQCGYLSASARTEQRVISPLLTENVTLSTALRRAKPLRETFRISGL
jgi:hypothetical protein